eukprot:6193305-Pleurochrysis_carterae.AAC.1
MKTSVLSSSSEGTSSLVQRPSSYKSKGIVKVVNYGLGAGSNCGCPQIHASLPVLYLAPTARSGEARTQAATHATFMHNAS